MLSPRPVPEPVGFVVKNGSKALSLTSDVIPVPVSVTEMRTYLPGRIAGYIPT
ncbi:hypothetical protein HB771_05735 (plasmid) [Rhizobium leguminosarum bv. viciae]|nr:hypothetical protein HB771_05735 [Rhizobium leguminosarum bv. viciae]